MKTALNTSCVPTVSFCITCKGRLDHLKQTLPHNLAANAGIDGVQFVVLDYDSPDGLEAWMKDHYQKEIDSGLIKYAKLANPSDFRMSHAKNMAHRLADGDIVCNLDADNMVSPRFAHWLQTTFASGDKIKAVYVQPHARSSAVHKFTKGEISGINGRIACRREDFLNVHGYDEELQTTRNEDGDFTQRLAGSGVQRINLPLSQYGSVIQHSNEERVKHMDDATRAEVDSLLKSGSVVGQAMRLIRGVEPPSSRVANADGHVGCGQVYVNFERTPTVIEPLDVLSSPTITRSVVQRV